MATSPEQKIYNEQLKELKAINLKNQIAINSQIIENLKSNGTPIIKYEGDPLNGYPFNFDWDMDSNLPVSAFPREMYPERPTTLRTQIAQDAIRLQSRAWYETVPQYSGIINHLKNFIIGTGMSITSVSDDDEELAEEIQKYLNIFAEYKNNKLNNRIFDIVLNYFRDGEDFVRLFPDNDNVQIRNVDSSTVRGPHNEITGPWSFGVLTDYPRDYEDVMSYHIWYADNSHENVSPDLMKHLKSETGANIKRGMPLAYRIRKQISQIVKLVDCCAIGESARQSIPYIVQYQLQQANTVAGQLNSRVPQPTTQYSNNQYNELGDPKSDISAGQVRHIGAGKEFINGPQGNDGSWAYTMLCQAIATAVNVPLWMVSGTASDTNFASSLVAESPLVKLIQNIQKQITEYMCEILESVVEIGIAQGKFPLNALDIVEIHCELPSPISRNRKEEIDADLSLMNANLMSPQKVCAHNNLDFVEEIDLTKQAEELGWENGANENEEEGEGKSTTPGAEKARLENNSE